MRFLLTHRSFIFYSFIFYFSIFQNTSSGPPSDEPRLIPEYGNNYDSSSGMYDGEGREWGRKTIYTEESLRRRNVKLTPEARGFVEKISKDARAQGKVALFVIHHGENRVMEYAFGNPRWAKLLSKAAPLAVALGVGAVGAYFTVHGVKYLLFEAEQSLHLIDLTRRQRTLIGSLTFFAIAGGVWYKTGPDWWHDGARWMEKKSEKILGGCAALLAHLKINRLKTSPKK